jgi:DNA polymerase-1
MSKLTSLEQSYSRKPIKGQQLTFFNEPVLAPTMPTIEASSSGPASVIVDTPESLQELVSKLQSAEIISFDTETTSTDQMSADLVGISLAVQPGQGYYIPVGHRTAVRQLPLIDVIQALQGPMADMRIPKAGHNLKYDFVMLARNGLRPDLLAFDSMIAEWLISPTSHTLGLKSLAWARQGIHMTNIDELIGKGKKQITMAEVPVEQAASYAAADAEVVLRLMPELQQELVEHGSDRLFAELEMPLVTTLADMEMAGVSLDSAFLHGMSADLATRLKEIEATIFTSVGASFNLNSPPQLSDALFNRLKLDPPDRTQRTATGFYSTSAGVLELLRGKHQVVDWILEYRELSKLKSTYLDALPLQVNPRTGRVHTSYNQTGSVTGRIASSDPNLQNIPIRTDLGRQVRRAFIASPGNLLLSVDYSQVELRIVAHMANDQAMLETFRAGQDIHAATAAAIYHVPLDQVTKEQRRRAKSINFGLIYGMSAFGLTRSTDLTLADSEDFMESYFKQFPRVKRYLDDMRRRAAEVGYVETLLGRRRYFPGLKNQTDRNIRNREEREAINAPIQGTAADIMKISMLHVPQALAAAGLSGKMLLQVHDELVLECPADQAQVTIDVVKGIMENAYPLSIPLSTEARLGPNWGEMQVI